MVEDILFKRISNARNMFGYPHGKKQHVSCVHILQKKATDDGFWLLPRIYLVVPQQFQMRLAFFGLLSPRFFTSLSNSFFGSGIWIFTRSWIRILLPHFSKKFQNCLLNVISESERRSSKINRMIIFRISPSKRYIWFQVNINSLFPSHSMHIHSRQNCQSKQHRL